MSWQRLLAGSSKYAVLIAFASFYLVPFYVMILTGLKAARGHQFIRDLEHAQEPRLGQLSRGVEPDGVQLLE